MTVEYFDNNGFYGFRVRRMVDSVPYQEYYSIIKNDKIMSQRQVNQVLSHAEAYDRQLLRMQVAAKFKRFLDCKPFRTTEGATGVRGITRNLRWDRTRAGVSYQSNSECFIIAIESTLTNKHAANCFAIKKNGVEKAARRAVAYYAKHKQLARSEYLVKRLLQDDAKRQAA